MTTKNLLETATLLTENESEEGTWRVRLISEGRGSSGIYPASTLESYAHSFNDVLSFENHPVGFEGPESRNFTHIVGRVVGETWTDTDERGKVGVYANWKPDSDFKDKLTEYKAQLGLSIFIEGDGHIDDDGEFVVDSFNEHDPYRSVDVVLAAGRGGRFEESLRKIYDSRRGESEKPSVTSALDERVSENMDEKLDQLIELMTSLVANEQAAKAEAAQAEADEKAVESAVADYDAAVKAIDEADLLPVQVESLRAEARKGTDVAPLIESAKAVKAEAVASVSTQDETPAGRFLGERQVESAADLGKVLR